MYQSLSGMLYMLRVHIKIISFSEAWLIIVPELTTDIKQNGMG